jgi:hypothetical protein
MDSPATEALLRFLQRSVTGRLTVGSSRRNHKVFLRGGEIVGATSSVDSQKLLHRLSLEKLFPISRVKVLENKVKRGASIVGHLIDEIDQRVLDQIFFEQYLDNISSYLGASAKPYYKELSAIFVDNLQLGHEPMEIIQRCAQTWDEAARLNPRSKIVIGPRPPDDDLQGIIFERLNQRPRSVTTLTMCLPLEPVAARALVANMIRRRMAALDGGPTEQSFSAEETTAIESIKEIRHYAAQVDASKVNAKSDPRTSGSGDLTDLKSWLESASNVSEEELNAFSDHDVHRGSMEEGAFSSDSKILDRVDVKNVDPLDDSDFGEPVNFNEPVVTSNSPPPPAHGNFSAPLLNPEEATTKLLVTNEILGTVARSFDEIEGDGRGQEIIVELIEGGPLRYADLFEDAGVHEDGTLETESILANLRHRPSGEHRMLLNQGLSDLIERCLSSAAEDLPDDTVDAILEQVVGYRQRLGL